MAKRRHFLPSMKMKRMRAGSKCERPARPTSSDIPWLSYCPDMAKRDSVEGSPTKSASGTTFAKIRAGELTSKMVLDWLDERKTWGATSRRGAVQAIKQAWKWAHSEGLLSANKLLSLSVAGDNRREGLVSAEHRAAMCIAADPLRKGKRACGSLRAVLIALKHSGARPSAISAVEARHVSPDGSAWVLPEHKTRAKTKRPLVVYLSPCAQTLTRILAHSRPTGRLFVTRKGTPWNKDLIARRFARLRDRLELPKTVVPYAYRHTFTTNALIKGVDLATVAALLGHSDVSMIARNYGHLDKATQHLKDAAKKAME